MSQITVTGSHVADTGEPATEVALILWSLQQEPAYNFQREWRAVANAEGAWTVTVPFGQYALTVFFSNCAPAAFGPYEFLPP
jgi:hypothetical protein